MAIGRHYCIRSIHNHHHHHHHECHATRHHHDCHTTIVIIMIVTPLLSSSSSRSFLSIILIITIIARHKWEYRVPRGRRMVSSVSEMILYCPIDLYRLPASKTKCQRDKHGSNQSSIRLTSSELNDI